MPRSWQEQLRAKVAEADRAIRQRQEDVRRIAAHAEAKGREVYARAIKTGDAVLARTPAEIRALGIAAMQGRLPQAVGETIVRAAVNHAKPGHTKPAAASVRPASTSPTPAAKVPPRQSSSAMQQARAGVSGFVDEASFGLADHVLAAGNAVGEAVRDQDVSGLWQDYNGSMDLKRAADAHDAAHYGAARNTGRVLGVVGTMAAMGAPGVVRGLVSAAPRLRAAEQAARLGLRYAPHPRGMTRMAIAGGAGSGLLDQGVTDALTGRKSGPLETVAAAAGGATGGIVTRVAGPTVGGAVGAATTSVLNDLANFRGPSFDDALEAAHAGGILGKLGGAAGARYAENLPATAKGDLGELFTDLKAAAAGDRILFRQQPVRLSPTRRGATRADTVSLDRQGRVRVREGKLGPEAILQPRQVEAIDAFGDNYLVDFWRFSDVGKVTGAAVSPLGATLTEEERPPWQAR